MGFGQSAREMEWYDHTATSYSRADPLERAEMKRRLEPYVEGKELKLVLDLGCGTGRYTGIISAQHLVGVDISSKMLGFAKAKDRDVVQADIHNLPFKQDAFDCVTCFGLLGDHVPFFESLPEVSRILVKNSLFVFTISRKSIGSLLVRRLLWSLGHRSDFALARFHESPEHATYELSKHGFRMVAQEWIVVKLKHLLVISTKLM